MADCLTLSVTRLTLLPSVFSTGAIIYSGEYYDIVPNVVNYKYTVPVYIYKIKVQGGFRLCFGFTH